MALRRPKGRVRVPDFEPRPALSAAVATFDLGSNSSWATWKFGNQTWQDEVWRLYDIVPEHHFLCGRIGDSVAQARLYVTQVSETGEETGEVEDPRIQRLAAVPLGTGSQRDENLRLAGIDLAGPGECWLVGEGAAADPENAEGSWFVVTSAAISREGGRGGKIKVKRPKNRGGDVLTLTDGQDILTRCWRSHPNDADQADSPSRPGIVPLREIELLTKREFAELDSRLTGAGMMFVPESLQLPTGPEDPPGLAGSMAFLQRVAAASMRDQSTAQAMVPIMATVPDHLLQFVDSMKPITFWSELSAEIGPMKLAAIKRLASSFELPNEVLEGIADGNHWTAWLITEEGIRWIKGYLGLIADALTRGFLRLALTKMGVPNPERYAYAFDPSPLAARPNRLDDALKLRELNLLSDEEVVRAGAFDPKQMPAEQEWVVQFLRELVKTQPDLILDPAVQSVLGLPEIRSVGLPPTAAQNADSGDPDGLEDGSSERREPPNAGTAPDAPDEGRSLTAALSRRIELLHLLDEAKIIPPEQVFNAACKLLVLRALELAGGRLTTPQERSARGRWAEVPRHELHARVGPITRDRAEAVTSDAWRHVGLTASDLGVNADDLQGLLSGYVLELLTRGMPHHDDLLFAALNIANRGNGLTGRDQRELVNL